MFQTSILKPETTKPLRRVGVTGNDLPESAFIMYTAHNPVSRIKGP